MPKLPRDASHDRLLRFLARNGWDIVHQGARHTIVGKSGVHVAIPRHATLKTGLIAAVLKQTRLVEKADEICLNRRTAAARTARSP